MNRQESAAPVQATPLWEAVEALRYEARLSMAQLARQAGLTRQTVYAMRDGRIPTAATLRDIARGLATHPQTGVLDPAMRERAWRELFAALDDPQGAAPPEPDPEAVRVRELLLSAGYDVNGAEVLDALARELLTLTQTERDAILPSMLAQIRAVRSLSRR